MRESRHDPRAEREARRDCGVAPEVTVDPASPWQIARVFSKLGCTSFGGPIAHLGYLREEFVVRRRWLEEERFADLVALCQFLPGPTSSQVVFGLGLHRGGLAGAAATSIGFTWPSVCVMIACAYGIDAVGDLSAAGWVHGLKVAAVAVVAHAVLQMAMRLCSDNLRRGLALTVAAVVLARPLLGTLPGTSAATTGGLLQLAALLMAGSIGLLVYRSVAKREAASLEPEPRTRPHRSALAALILCGALLFGLPIAARSTTNLHVSTADSFYRSGALIFGGGHIMLPLLHAEVVPQGLVDEDTFLAGYGAAQAIPGPLSTFAAYLGASIAKRAAREASESGRGGALEVGPGWALGCWCVVWIFLPSWLLVAGAWPFWHSLRRRAAVRAALLGTNAGVVGLLLSALVRPVASEGLRGPLDVGVAIGGFVLLQSVRAPSWVVVGMTALVIGVAKRLGA